MDFDEMEAIRQQTIAIKNSTIFKLDNKSTFDIYADKQLTHLVVSENFDFEAIANILTNALRYTKTEFTSKSCQQRWYQLHRDRDRLNELKEQVKQNKRLQSIMGFNNPYALYNYDELIENLQKNQKKDKRQDGYVKVDFPQYKGYNIFKDSIRKIDNMEEHLKKEQIMRLALKDAQQQCNKIFDKPMLFAPKYGSQFQVIGEELTVQVAQKMLSHKIQLERVEREMMIEVQETSKYQSKVKKQIEKAKQQFEINQNWDEYQSD